MNQEARDMLVEAELRGVKQIRFTLTRQEGRCALGVLGFRLGLAEPDIDKLLSKYGFLEREVTCPFIDSDLEMNSCRPLLEVSLVAHLNDDHQLSFLDIARKFPEPSE